MNTTSRIWLGLPTEAENECIASWPRGGGSSMVIGWTCTTELDWPESQEQQQQLIIQIISESWDIRCNLLAAEEIKSSFTALPVWPLPSKGSPGRRVRVVPCLKTTALQSRIDTPSLTIVIAALINRHRHRTLCSHTCFCNSIILYVNNRNRKSALLLGPLVK